jgi:hypothetical protein
MTFKKIWFIFFLSLIFLSACGKNRWWNPFDFSRTRPEKPTRQDEGLKLPNSPQNVLHNLRVAYNARLLDDYMDCFVSPQDKHLPPEFQFQFISNETKDNGEPLIKNWYYAEEKQCAYNMFNEVERGGQRVTGLQLEFTDEGERVETYLGRKVVIIKKHYILIVYINNTGGGYHCQQKAEFSLVNAGDEKDPSKAHWKIYRWLDKAY